MIIDYSLDVFKDACVSDKEIKILSVVIASGMDTKKATELLGYKSRRTVQMTLKAIRERAGGFEVTTPAKEEKTEDEVNDYNRKIDELSSGYYGFVGNKEYVLVVTSAQNGTPVHDRFWNNLNSLVSNQPVPSKLLVIPIRYKNPTSVFGDLKNDSWDTKVMPFLCENDFSLCSNISVLGDLKTQPTATRPLSGLEQVSGFSSAIVGHTKLELKCVATPSNRLPKIIASTGACTIPNYTDSKAGYKGKKRHSISAILIHVKSNKFFIRQIVADDNGDFVDLNSEYFNGSIEVANRPSCLSTGDLHGVNHDPKALGATIDIIKTLKPRTVTFDDTLDFESGSHHNKKDPVHNFLLQREGRSSIGGELSETFKVIDNVIKNSDSNTHFVIKRSNHDEHFERWVKETDPRTDPENSLIWCEAYKAMVYGKDPYKLFARDMLKSYDKVRFLKRDEIYMVNGVAHDGHGDLGANGSRGNLMSFTKFGCPGQWAHSHTPGIMDDQYQNGTLCKLRMGYNRGPSSWMHCNTIQYCNGKRSLLFIIDGEWKFKKESGDKS